MKYTTVTNPQYANAEKTMINCLVKFDGFAGLLPFTASASDCEEHGKKIFAELLAKKWGDIKPYDNA